MSLATWPSNRADLARDRVLVGAEDLAHLLRDRAGGERGRADQVDEHDRELAPLGLGRPVGARCGAASSLTPTGGERARQVPDRLQHYLARPQRQPELAQVGVGQLGQGLVGQSSAASFANSGSKSPLLDTRFLHCCWPASAWCYSKRPCPGADQA